MPVTFRTILVCGNEERARNFVSFEVFTAVNIKNVVF
jgi:hypothetical protein